MTSDDVLLAIAEVQKFRNFLDRKIAIDKQAEKLAKALDIVCYAATIGAETLSDIPEEESNDTD